MVRIVVLISMVIAIAAPAAADWGIDLSRRSKEMRNKDYQTPPETQQKEGVFDFLFTAGQPIHEIVVLNTDKGFVPSTIRAREGMQYRIFVVNVNEKEKNVSFVLDSFSEHHATYYGNIKSFVIHPQKEGIYTFQSPETSAQGRLVVYPAGKDGAENRLPASE